MASEFNNSVHNGANTKLLRMDVIEMTLLLKSIGFRLDSMDFDDRGTIFDKKSNENGHDSMSEPDVNSHSINVRITCSKSKLISNLSYKYTESDVKLMSRDGKIISTACTCPKREQHDNNNSFWEVQSSGTFANKRRSIGALALTPDNQTSSNLLPTLSPKSITLTQVLMQVLLCQYEHNTKHGEFSVKDIDIKSIMLAVENGSITRKSTDGDTDSNLTKENVESLPNMVSSIVTAPKLHVNGQLFDEFGTKNTALNETVNTEAFSSPKSDLITSSPNGTERTEHIVERDASIINNLNEARNYIDRALLVMKLNVTRNLTHDAISPTMLTVTPDLEKVQHKMFIDSIQTSQQTSSNKNVKAIATTTTPSAQPNRISSLSRRASIGGTTIKPTSLNLPKENDKSGVERRASLSKLSLVRRAVSGIGNRTIGSSSVTTSSTTSTATKAPIQPASKLNIKARTSSLTASVSRRIPGRTNTATSNTNAAVSSSGLLARKTTLTARTPVQVSKLATKK